MKWNGRGQSTNVEHRRARQSYSNFKGVSRKNLYFLTSYIKQLALYKRLS